MIQERGAEAAEVVVGVDGLDGLPLLPQHRLHVSLSNAALDEVGRQREEVKVVSCPERRVPSVT